jgi:hypothetical protein
LVSKIGLLICIFAETWVCVGETKHAFIYCLRCLRGKYLIELWECIVCVVYAKFLPMSARRYNFHSFIE